MTFFNSEDRVQVPYSGMVPDGMNSRWALRMRSFQPDERQDMYHSPFEMFFGRKEKIFFFRMVIVFCQDALLPVEYASFLGSVAMISMPAMKHRSWRASFW
jgi:hypothetical protein